MSRIFELKEKLDYGKVKEFFTERSKKIEDVGLLSVTMYQSEEFARQRDTHEKETVVPYFNLHSTSKVLDVGCGTGRWGHFLADKVNSYLGIDFCENYIAAAQSLFDQKNLDSATHRFQHLSATDFTEEHLAIAPPFDLIIIAGLMPYLNDEDVLALLTKIAIFSKPGTMIYIREPMGIEKRLTLKEHFSEELQQHYNAIYRTAAEYEVMLKQAFNNVDFQISVSKTLYPPSLCNRVETQQQFLIIEVK